MVHAGAREEKSYLLIQQAGVPYLGGNEMSSSYSLSLKTDSSLSNSKS